MTAAMAQWAHDQYEICTGDLPRYKTAGHPLRHLVRYPGRASTHPLCLPFLLYCHKVGAQAEAAGASSRSPALSARKGFPVTNDLKYPRDHFHSHWTCFGPLIVILSTAKNLRPGVHHVFFMMLAFTRAAVRCK